MAATLYTSKGTTVLLGQQLGKGGEGAVFDVPSFSGQVAKVYHQALDLQKQQKLIFMTNASDPKLLEYVSWPKDTLHAKPGGPVIGFLMPKVAGRDPIHNIYSPAHRKKEKPKAAWDFLIFTARNTAAAFESVHKHGHAIGDVNQDSLFVANDSRVTIIDADSFQINDHGRLYPCKVGVAMFTPPELQGISTFNGIVRTPNHDNFGLALLIFHLLLGGRHPFSGVPLKSGVGDALEEDIKALRYAYAKDSQHRGIAPPPRSLPMTIVPSAMQAMFEAAFTERGTSLGRPSAAQWVNSLDTLRTSLKKCSSSFMHKVPGHLGKCPWCELEHQGVIYFIDLSSAIGSTLDKGFVLAKAWTLIEAVKAPPIPQVPSITSIQVKAHPLPQEIAEAATKIFMLRGSVVVAVIVLIAILHAYWLFITLGGIAGWFLVSSGRSAAIAEEKNKRTQEQANAQREFEVLVRVMSRDCGPGPFQAALKRYREISQEYDNLNNKMKDDLDNLAVTAEKRQKALFLEGFFIDTASISGVGKGRKAMLRSWGIETAADVTSDRVGQVTGFGPSLTRAVVDWRNGLERRFVFNRALAVTEQEKNAVRARYATQRLPMESELTKAPINLHTLAQSSINQEKSLRDQLDKAARRLAQANADLAAT